MLEPELLKNCVPLHKLSVSNLARLARRLTIENVAKGGVICHEDEPDSESIYLLEGGVERRSHTTSMTRVLQAGTSDAWFALAPGRSRPYTGVATVPVRLFRIDNAALDRAELLDEVSTTISRVDDSGVEFAGDSEWLEEMTAQSGIPGLAEGADRAADAQVRSDALPGRGSRDPAG